MSQRLFKASSSARRFLRDRAGNFGLMTAVAMLPILGAVGLAVDYAEMTRQQTAYYNALDAAALVAAKAFGEGYDDETIEEMARGFFEANVRDPNSVEFVYHGPQERGNVISIKVSAKGDYEPYFFGAFRKMLNGSETELTVAASSEVAVAATTVEMALVLDNSTSMSGNKITALKKSATDLVETLHKRVIRVSDPDAVRFAIVPFGASVNVGAEYAAANWMDTEGRSPVHHENLDWSTVAGATKQANGSWKKGTAFLTRQWLYGQIKASWGGCIEARPYPYNQTDETPSASNPASLFVPMFAPDEPDYVSVNKGSELNNIYKNSYIDDFKANPNRKSNTTYVGTAAKQFARQVWVDKYLAFSSIAASGPNKSCTTAPLLPLTADKSAAVKRIADMKANGYTNIAEGVAWGLRVLSPGEPFTEGRAYDEPHNIKAMVVMSDGENVLESASSSNLNQSVYGAYGYTATGRIWEGADKAKKNNNGVEALDTHMLASCEAAKAAGITVYTIAFDVKDNSNVAKNLKSCASTQKGSGAPLYYNAGNAAELESAFKAIGSHVSNLRIFM